MACLCGRERGTYDHGGGGDFLPQVGRPNRVMPLRTRSRVFAFSNFTTDKESFGEKDKKTGLGLDWHGILAPQIAAFRS